MGDCGFAHAKAAWLPIMCGFCLKGPPRCDMPPAYRHAPLCTDFWSTRLALALGSNPQSPMPAVPSLCFIRAAGAANTLWVILLFAAQKKQPVLAAFFEVYDQKRSDYALKRLFSGFSGLAYMPKRSCRSILFNILENNSRGIRNILFSINSAPLFFSTSVINRR